MQECKMVKVSILVGSNFFVVQFPKSQEDIEYIAHFSYASVVGSLMHAMVCTRLDISHVLGLLSRYIKTTRKEHWSIAKRVFKYFSGMKYVSIYYQQKYEKVEVYGFVDSDWDGDLDERWSTSGYMFKLFREAFSWMSRR